MILIIKWIPFFIAQAISLLALLTRIMTFIEVAPGWQGLYSIFSWSFSKAPIWLVLFSAVALWQILHLFKKDDMTVGEWLCRLFASLMSLANVLGWAVWTPVLFAG